MTAPTVQAPETREIARQWLVENSAMPMANQRVLARTAASLAEVAVKSQEKQPARIAVSGAPGSGKSTLCQLLSFTLQQIDIPCFTLGVDDYYYGRARRKQLADQIHPLLKQRGVPGTHDLDLLTRDFDALTEGKTGQLKLPRFDKSRDERSSSSHPLPLKPPRVILLEGWFVGSSPPARFPQSALRERHDPDLHWHHYVWDHWKRFYETFLPRIQHVWFLRDPGWQQVIDWRWQQEKRLPQPLLKSRDEVSSFLETFQPLYELIRSQLAASADLCLQLDPNHLLTIKE